MNYTSRKDAKMRLTNNDVPSKVCVRCIFAMLLLALASVVSGAQGTCGHAGNCNATAPTANQDAGTIDQTWQRASAPYDNARAEILKRVDRQASNGPFRPDWESLAAYHVPDWYRDAKFGIFIHWGLYAVPAFSSEQYPQRMYTAGSKEYRHH